jgi:hypothetical protein
MIMSASDRSSGNRVLTPLNVTLFAIIATTLAAPFDTLVTRILATAGLLVLFTIAFGIVWLAVAIYIHRKFGYRITGAAIGPIEWTRSSGVDEATTWREFLGTFKGERRPDEETPATIREYRTLAMTSLEPLPFLAAILGIVLLFGFTLSPDSIAGRTLNLNPSTIHMLAFAGVLIQLLYRAILLISNPFIRALWGDEGRKRKAFLISRMHQKLLQTGEYNTLGLDQVNELLIDSGDAYLDTAAAEFAFRIAMEHGDFELADHCLKVGLRNLDEAPKGYIFESSLPILIERSFWRAFAYGDIDKAIDDLMKPKLRGFGDGHATLRAEIAIALESGNSRELFDLIERAYQKLDSVPSLDRDAIWNFERSMLKMLQEAAIDASWRPVLLGSGQNRTFAEPEEREVIDSVAQAFRVGLNSEEAELVAPTQLPLLLWPITITVLSLIATALLWFQIGFDSTWTRLVLVPAICMVALSYALVFPACGRVIGAGLAGATVHAIGLGLFVVRRRGTDLVTELSRSGQSYNGSVVSLPVATDSPARWVRLQAVGGILGWLFAVIFTLALYSTIRTVGEFLESVSWWPWESDQTSLVGLILVVMVFISGIPVLRDEIPKLYHSFAGDQNAQKSVLNEVLHAYQAAEVSEEEWPQALIDFAHVSHQSESLIEQPQ